MDGVRGLAVFLVLFFHYVVGAVRFRAGSWQAAAMVPFGLAWTGVDLFFVLSGFLIGGILYDAKYSPSYFKAFYLRRMHRIFPIYFILFALFLAGIRFAGSDATGPLRVIFNQDIPTWSFPLFIQNFLMNSRRTFGTAWMGITWSLAIEEHFYLLLPLLVRRLSYHGILAVAATAVVTAPVLRIALIHSGNAYFGPYTLLPCRADALGFGVLAAMACRNRKAWEWLTSHRRYLYGALLVLGCGFASLTVWQRYLYGIGLSCIALFYVLLLLLAVANPGRVEAGLFRSHWLTRLGLISYAVYLFHEGINELIHWALFGKRPEITGLPTLAATLISLSVVLMLCAVSWRFLEKPLIRRAHARYRYAASDHEEFSTAPLPSPGVVSTN